jgi:hypothetical protein
LSVVGVVVDVIEPGKTELVAGCWWRGSLRWVGSQGRHDFASEFGVTTI